MVQQSQRKGNCEQIKMERAFPAMSTKLKNQEKIEPQKALEDLGLPFMDVILTERFLLPPEALSKIGEPIPKTLQDVSTLTGMPLEEVWSVLCDCLELDKNLDRVHVDLTVEAAKEGVLLVDMRPGVDLETEPLHPDARLFHNQNPQTFLPFLRTLDKVYVISGSDAHAWSAAVSLKKMGVTACIPLPICK